MNVFDYFNDPVLVFQKTKMRVFRNILVTVDGNEIINVIQDKPDGPYRINEFEQGGSMLIDTIRIDLSKYSDIDHFESKFKESINNSIFKSMYGGLYKEIEENNIILSLFDYRYLALSMNESVKFSGDSKYFVEKSISEDYFIYLNTDKKKEFLNVLLKNREPEDFSSFFYNIIDNIQHVIDVLIVDDYNKQFMEFIEYDFENYPENLVQALPEIFSKKSELMSLNKERTEKILKKIANTNLGIGMLENYYINESTGELL